MRAHAAHRRALLAALLALVTSATACNDGPTDVAIPTTARVAGTSQRLKALEPELSSIARKLLEEHRAGAIVIGLLDRTGWVTFSYGRRTLTDETPPDERTIFEIGSITKTFTGLLLAQELNRGTVDLNAPINPQLPKGVEIPAYEDAQGTHPITWLDLATHTSGLPRTPTNWRDGYTIVELASYLKHWDPPRLPGSEYEYSNVGVGIEALGLQTINQQDFEPLVIERICDPLHLPDTRVNLSLEQSDRLAAGWDSTISGLEEREPWDWLFEGAGSLRSTAIDMLTYGAAYARMMPPDGTAADIQAQTTMSDDLKEAVLHRRRIDDDLVMGLNWHIYTPYQVLWHTGQTEQTSFLGLHRDKNVVAVVLSTNAEEFEGAQGISDLGSTALWSAIDLGP